MVYKQRTESEELKQLRCLNARMDFSEDDSNYYANLEKGFEGEKKYDFLIGDLTDNWIIINDLLLKYNNTLFQIDSLLISHDRIFANNIKNFVGDHYLDKDRWYMASRKEIKNPLEQLVRCESLLRRLLHDLGFNLPIESQLVFMNPHFYLYQAPLNLPAVFPSQVDRYIKTLMMKSGKLNNRHFKLAEKLVSLHIAKGPITHVPAYSFEHLKKMIVCGSCWHSSMDFYNKEILVCKDCGHKESLDSAVLRSTGEYSMLFPERKITTNSILEWCGIIDSKKMMRRILSKHFAHVQNGRGSYFEKK